MVDSRCPLRIDFKQAGYDIRPIGEKQTIRSAVLTG